MDTRNQKARRMSKLVVGMGTILFLTAPWLCQVLAEPLVTKTTLASCGQQEEQTLFRPISWGTLAQEPTEEYLFNEDINIITGLYTREYSLQQDGVVDYKTARQIVISEYNKYWNSVVYTIEFPLFYWTDADHDGQFDMWVDQQVEGVPCDIVPYQVHDKNPDDIHGLF